MLLTPNSGGPPPISTSVGRAAEKQNRGVTYTLKTAMLVHMVNLSVALINNSTAQVFRDLGGL
jgi:hypothetical protein